MIKRAVLRFEHARRVLKRLEKILYQPEVYTTKVLAMEMRATLKLRAHT